MARRNQPRTIRLMLVDDHPVVREGLRSCLAEHRHLRIVAEAANGGDALRLARKHRPDLVLMDINMPGMNGIEATRELVRTRRGTRVLILTVNHSSEYITQMMRCGARGYVLKEAPPDELVRAIESVVSGVGFYCSVPFNPAEDDGPAKGPLPEAVLSRRELAVLQRVARGESTKEIASAMGVTVSTVKTYRERLGRKLGLHSAAALAAYAGQRGIV